MFERSETVTNENVFVPNWFFQLGVFDL